MWTRRSVSTAWSPLLHVSPGSKQVVLRKLLFLSPSKAVADGIITNRILIACAPFLSASLTYLLNISQINDCFLSAWKCAVVTPLFKNRGSSRRPSNYHPISLLSAVGKLRDSIQSYRLLSYLIRHNLIFLH